MAKEKKKKAKKKTKKIKKGQGESSSTSLDLYHNGTGEFVLPNGDKYEGEYCAHRIGLVWREGRGIYTTHDGDVYEGNWKDDKLVDNEELVIKYANGHQYYGRLSKGKYSGPATYILRDDLPLSMELANNLPVGQAIMIDKNENFWFATADLNSGKCVFLIENYFFRDIPEERGQGLRKVLKEEQKINQQMHVQTIEVPIDHLKESEIGEGQFKDMKYKEGEPKAIQPTISWQASKTKPIKPSYSKFIGKSVSNISRAVSEEDRERLRRAKLFDREKEEKIFAKTMKTTLDIDFTKSTWYQNYLKFSFTRETIENKILEGGVHNLSKQEKKWCRGYKRYLNYQYLRSLAKEVKKTDDEVDTALWDEFWLKDAEEKSKPVKVLYPRKDWDIFFKNESWWKADYVPATRSDVDVFDSSVSSESAREVLRPQAWELREEASKLDQTIPELEYCGKIDFVKRLAKE